MYFDEDRIRIGVRVQDWREAVQVVGELLVGCGGAEKRYIEAMIQTVEDLGPYIVITPGIAIPHARPEAGALKLKLAAIQLEPPIEFGNPDNDPVSLVIAFSSPDKEAHLEALVTLARKFAREGFLKDVQKAHTSKQLAALLNHKDE